jgi:hypothetical protein
LKTLEEGAKMLLVGWVKNWTMRTLLGVLCDEVTHKLDDEFVERCVKNFPFMPSHHYWYAAQHGNGLEIRRFVAEAYPKLSERLWELDDYKDCLKYAEYVQKQKAGNIKAQTKYGQKEKSQRAKEVRHYRASIIGYRESRKAFQKHQRSSWTTVKA